MDDEPVGLRGGLAERSRLRRERLVAHRTADHDDAEAWDLEFWQTQGPEARLSALVALRRDVERATAGRPGESQ